MCNGSGSVRSTIEDNPPIVRTVIKEKKIHPKYLFNLEGITYEVSSRINKNEFQLFSKGIVKYLLARDYRRAAVSFNHLIELTVGTKEEPEKQLHKEIFSLKKLVEDIIPSNKSKEIGHYLNPEYDEKIQTLTEKLEGVYVKYF